MYACTHTHTHTHDARCKGEDSNNSTAMSSSEKGKTKEPELMTSLSTNDVSYCLGCVQTCGDSPRGRVYECMVMCMYMCAPVYV